ncbi:MAG: riboflavin biosynthesis protein RibF [Candidatus Omnitrophica bacterium]|jgi:riboflavin kinase/FMN adenylyltransferase|nr:riboflavin biosynthesis protein RibF [Candidatus Omnitrophota bacterium]MDD5690111.1 riboflavin biosynthesis protein RibF [Candidatus Omnitrophota bacterium]
MIVITRIKKIRKFKDPVVALGVFDGLHRGHRNILQAAVKKAKEIKGTSIALTFFPHPQKEKSLYSLKHRLRLISELGVDVCIVINFSLSFAKMSAENFIAKILAKKIRSRFIYIGKNFHFGKGALGDCRLLSTRAKENNFNLKIFKVIKSNGRLVSSTAIRRLINGGKIKGAERLLGRRVSVLGSVIRGSRIARALGFPTANINPHHEVIPPPGIYAVQVIFAAKKYGGICYIGSRPTVCARKDHLQIEVHIFGFHKKIYGRFLEIQFVKLIRRDKKFVSMKDLTVQIKKDIISCRKILQRSC